MVNSVQDQLSEITLCLKNNLTLRIQTEPITVGGDATAFDWFLAGYSVHYVSKTGHIPLHPFQP